MNGLKKLIEQQHKFEAFKTKKALQLSEHVSVLKNLIVSSFLESCPDLQYNDNEVNTLKFSFQELEIEIEIINPITQEISEEYYNFSKRARKKLAINLSIQRKMDAIKEYYLIEDITQYKTDGEYTYKVSEIIDTNILEILDKCFNNSVGLKVEFKPKDDLPF